MCTWKDRRTPNDDKEIWGGGGSWVGGVGVGVGVLEGWGSGSGSGGWRGRGRGVGGVGVRVGGLEGWGSGSGGSLTAPLTPGIWNQRNTDSW